MKMNYKNMMNLNSCLNFKHDSNKTINKIINSIIKNDVEIEIVDPENFNDVEFLKLINLLHHIKIFKPEIKIDDEFVVNELYKRYDNNINNLIKLYIDPEIEIDDEFVVNDNIQIKNLYINETLFLYEFIEYYEKFDNNDYYENFYYELIDHIYIYNKFDDDVYYLIDEILNIPENVTNYINYDEIIDDLIIDNYFYEIEYNNIFYLIDNSYY